MMVGFFKSKYSFQPAIVIVIALFLFIDIFINPPESSDVFFCIPLIHDFYTAICNVPKVAVLTGFIILLFNAFLFNSIIISNNLMGKHTYMPALVYILLMSCFRVSIIPINFILVNFIILLIIRLLFKIYDKSDPFQQIFNIGMLLAILSFIYFPGILFLLFVWMVFIQFNIISWREWTILLIGILVPYIFLVFFYFWFSHLFDLFQLLKGYSQSIHISLHFSTYRLIFLAGLFLVIIISLVYTLNGMERNTIMVRKKIFLFISLTIISLAGGIINNEPFNGLSLAMLPSGIFVSNFFQTVKKRFWREFIFLLILLLFVFSRLFI